MSLVIHGTTSEAMNREFDWLVTRGGPMHGVGITMNVFRQIVEITQQIKKTFIGVGGKVENLTPP